MMVMLWSGMAMAVPPMPGLHFDDWTEAGIEDMRRHAPLSAPDRQASGSGITINLAPRGLVILVSFSDTVIKTEKAEIDSMLNGLNYSRRYIFQSAGQRTLVNSKGSAKTYFTDQSNGSYCPQFDVVGPVQVSKSCTYYGQNYSGQTGNDKYAYKLVQEACNAVDSQVDFRQYDNDKDGKVDFVYILYAGYSESDGAGSDLIWPHASYATYHSTLQLDGKIIDRYACSNEIDYASGVHEGIGTFCHEFSHVLGLSDLYATNNTTHKTMGMWDIMDAGPYNNHGNTPPNFSGYERMIMGWTIPRLLTDSENVQLTALSMGGEVLLVSPTGKHNLSGTNPDPATFYVLENRQLHGWDTHLRGHGLLLTRVQFNATQWKNNNTNNSSLAMGVDIIEADGIAQSSSEDPYSYYGKMGDCFPTGSTHYDSIAPFNTYPITEIEESFKKIRFKFRGGVREDTELEDIHVQEASPAQKVLYRGRIYMWRNGQWYDIYGNRTR